jgi:hypothetical protein
MHGRGRRPGAVIYTGYGLKIFKGDKGKLSNFQGKIQKVLSGSRSLISPERLKKP